MSRVERSLPQKRTRLALPLALGSSAEATAAAGAGGAAASRQPGGTIDAYYLSRHCAVCDGQTSMDKPVCETCLRDPQVQLRPRGARVVLTSPTPHYYLGRLRTTASADCQLSSSLLRSHYPRGIHNVKVVEMCLVAASAAVFS